MFVKRPTTLVQHAHAKSGKTIARAGNKACSWGSHDGSTSKRKSHKKNRAGHLSVSRLRQPSRDLLFPDQLAVEVDIVEDHHAGAGFRPIIQNQVNALHLGSGCDGGNGLGGIELEPFPSGSGSRLS